MPVLVFSSMSIHLRSKLRNATVTCVIGLIAIVTEYRLPLTLTHFHWTSNVRAMIQAEYHHTTVVGKYNTNQLI